MTGQFSIRVNEVRKKLGPNQALAGVSLDFAEGKMHGIIGPEGAGKTTLMRTLLGLLRPDAGEAALTPARVKEIAVARFEMVVRDLVGHPTAPGSSWTAADDDPVVQKKTVTVDKLEPCGTATCARVSAQYEVNPKAAALRALRSGAIFLAQNGVNPAQTEVLDTSFDARDELQVEPSTMIDHAATFSQTARVTFVGANGQPLQFEFRTALEQSSVFP